MIPSAVVDAQEEPVPLQSSAVARTRRRMRLRPVACACLVAGAALLTAPLLTGCAVTPEPLTAEENAARVAQDLRTVFAEAEPVTGPIGLEEAMARAIKHNLDRRVELMNAVVLQRQLDLSHYDMLPRLAAQAGYTSRSNENASSSQSILSGTQSLEPSISQERTLLSAQLGLTWNVLDFGVSYIRAQQQADRVLMAEEQRRKVVHNIIQDVRVSYWRAVAAQRVMNRIDPLLARVEAALAEARQTEAQRLRAPLEALEYQRTLIATLDQLNALRRDLVTAKIELAALMSLHPGQDYSVVVPSEADGLRLPSLALAPEAIEQIALLNRPELLQQTYQHRITVAETRRVLLEMLPGLSVSLSGNYDSNRFLVNNTWASGGVGLVWNLLNLASTPARYSFAEANADLEAARRVALSMAVLAQVNVGYARFRQALSEFESASQLHEIDRRILQQYTAAGQAHRIGQLDVIRAEINALLVSLRRDAAYASVQNAFGALMVSAGADPLPETVPDHDIGTLAQSIRDTMRNWESGTIRLRTDNAAASRWPDPS